MLQHSYIKIGFVQSLICYKVGIRENNVDILGKVSQKNRMSSPESFSGVLKYPRKPTGATANDGLSDMLLIEKRGNATFPKEMVKTLGAIKTAESIKLL
jgi:hypothetical protein